MLLLDGVDPLGQYRPFCDACADKLASVALRLDQARALATSHARNYGHDVRIEPWESFQLIELVRANEYGGPFAGSPDAPETRAASTGVTHPRVPRAGCRCLSCRSLRQRREG